MQLDDVDDDGSGDGGRIDYDSIGRELRESSSEETGQSLQSAIDKLNEDLAKLSPNMRVMEKLNETENRLHDAEQEYHEIKQRAKSLQDRLAKIKNKRYSFPIEIDLINEDWRNSKQLINTWRQKLMKFTRN